jgi:uncharacterized membrane protein
MTAIADTALDRAGRRAGRRRPMLQAIFICFALVLLFPAGIALVVTVAEGRPLPWQFHMPWVSPHILIALTALALGVMQLALKKGDRRHRLVGYAWCVLMVGLSVSGMAIQLQPGHVTLIHRISSGFAIANLVLVPLAIWGARTGRLRLHKIAVLIMFANMLSSGAMAFIPFRAVGALVFGLLH